MAPRTSIQYHRDPYLPRRVSHQERDGLEKNSGNLHQLWFKLAKKQSTQHRSCINNLTRPNHRQELLSLSGQIERSLLQIAPISPIRRREKLNRGQGWNQTSRLLSCVDRRAVEKAHVEPKFHHRGKISKKGNLTHVLTSWVIKVVWELERKCLSQWPSLNFRNQVFSQCQNHH